MKANKLALLTSMMILGSIDNRTFAQVNDFEPKKIPTPETDAEKAKRLGLKEWNINGKIVYAATKKKALKLAELNLKK